MSGIQISVQRQRHKTDVLDTVVGLSFYLMIQNALTTVLQPS